MGGRKGVQAMDNGTMARRWTVAQWFGIPIQTFVLLRARVQFLCTVLVSKRGIRSDDQALLMGDSEKHKRTFCDAQIH